MEPRAPGATAAAAAAGDAARGLDIARGGAECGRDPRLPPRAARSGSRVAIARPSVILVTAASRFMYECTWTSKQSSYRLSL
jgi:hypothetical protein